MALVEGSRKMALVEGSTKMADVRQSIPTCPGAAGRRHRLPPAAKQRVPAEAENTVFKAWLLHPCHC